MMKYLAVIVLAVALSATACTAASRVDSSTAGAVGSKTPRPTATKFVESRLGVDEQALEDLTIEVWHPWYGVEASFFESLVDEFNEGNAWGIQVHATSQINFSYLYENVTTSLPTANRPHLVIALPEHALGWDEDGLVTDLTPYVEDPRYGIEATDFPLVFWDQDKSGQAHVGLPAQRTARFLLWNETWAEELGFESPPSTGNEFRAQACAAHQAMLLDPTPENDGMGGWIVDTDAMTAYAWLLAFQGGVLEGNDYRFLTPNNIAAFRYVKGLAEEACAWQISAQGNPREAFAARQALFATASLEDLPAQARAFAEANNSDKWTVIAFPGDDVLAVYGASYVLLDSSPAEQLAGWLFMRWLIEPAQDARWVETTHLFPLRTSTLRLLERYAKSHPQWAEAVKLLSEAHLQPQLASWRTVKVMLGDGFEHMFRVNVPSGQAAVILAQMEATSRELSE